MWENFKAAFLTQNEIWPPEIREREREREREGEGERERERNEANQPR